MSNASKLLTTVIILFLLGLFLPYLGINIFTESPYPENINSSRQSISSSIFEIPNNAHTRNNKIIKSIKGENERNRQKTTANQQKSFDEIFADINKD